MSGVLVDSNVLLDIFTEDRRWYSWSAGALAQCADDSVLTINPIIYAEVSIRFDTMEELDDVLSEDYFQRLPLPWEAAFLAGKAFLKYRRRRAARRTPLPDFYIGAHAAIAGLRVLTRDPARYRSYFPRLSIVAP
ncbi:MAG: type II toxin-antitoxin system VapC family toxin [Candidatus Binatia bacterium]